MTIDLPSWVPEFEEEFNTFIKRKKTLLYVAIVLIGIVIVLFGITIVLIFITHETKFVTLVVLFSYFILMIVGLLYSIATKKLSPVSKYLAAMIYSIGFNLEKNSDSKSKIYINNMENYLKNCDNIIADVSSSLVRASYVNITEDYLEKLDQIIRLLNEYCSNYEKYTLNKSEIALKITKLADLIHGDNGYVTDEHVDIIKSLERDFVGQEMNEKPLHISKTERIMSASKAFILGLPYTLKLFIYVAFVFLVTYGLITYVALSKGIPQDDAFGYAIVGGIGALVPALMVKEHILK